MIICERCGKNPAAVHMTNFINGQKTELHLCSKCAGEEGGLTLFESPFIPMSVKDLLSQMVGEKAHQACCSRCGMTLERFREEGRLGCSNCYKDLKNELMPILRSVQGKLQHAGAQPKAPKKAGELLDLKKQLEEAIQAEEYERAAKLRDMIRQKEQKEESTKGRD